MAFYTLVHGMAEIRYRDTWANLGLELTSNGKLTEPRIQRLYNIS
jgi:hypothetical protein